MELEEITHIAKIPAIEGLANNVIKNRRFLHKENVFTNNAAVDG